MPAALCATVGGSWLLLLVLGVTAVSSTQVFRVTDGGKPRSEIWVTPRVLAVDNELTGMSSSARRGELERRRLRDSVTDFVDSIEKMSGVRLSVVATDTHVPADKSRHILIGELAQAAFGSPQASVPGGQGFRVVIRRTTVGLSGESDLGTSYAIFEILHRLGCRWFMPGDLGEVIPARRTIELPLEDSSITPATYYRDLWYRDDAYARRNRLGGLKINAGHALERYITPQQRRENPKWLAQIDSQRDPSRPQLSWGNPEVAEAIATELIARLDEDYVESLSLSPMDTTVFGSGPEETALDAGDWDPTIGTVSLTDRLLSFANRIAERVSTKYPNVRLGLLAYVQFTRPPIKVRPHQNIVIELAPITYNRAHPMTDDRHPASADLRRVVEGWGEVTGGEFACYPYAYNLGEVSAPYPMIRKWSIDLPILFDHGCKYWQPETLPNFETSLPGLYLGLRLAWDPTLRPREVLEEFYDRFYGKSSSAMRLYWETMDNAWVDSEEFSGNGWGHLSRFPEEVLTAARAALDEALEIAESVAEYRRVRLAERSFSQLELLVAMRRDLNRGRFSHLKRDAERWAGGHMAMGREYSENYAFTTLPNTPWRSTAIRYFNRFSRPILESAGAIHESGTRLTATPIRRFRFQPDPTRTGLSSGWQTPDFNDRMWPTTDTGTETWSTLGLYDYMGTVWYRTPIPIRSKELSAAKPVFLWIAGADDELEVFVNGHHSPAVEPDGSRQPVLSGYARPASFDITAALKGSGPNMLAIRASRTFLNELGTGGLLGPAVVYQPK